MKTRKRWFERDHFTGVEREVRPLAARLAWCPPNVLTLVGLILVIPMCAAFMRGQVMLGLVLFAASLLMDLLDGPVARLQDEGMTDEQRAREAKRPFFGRGKTAFGAAFDPFVDKARYFPALILLGWGRLWWPFIILSLALAVLLTGLRFQRFRTAAALLMTRWAAVEERFDERVYGERVQRPPMKMPPSSNKLGKYKVHVEAVLIFTLVLLPHDPVSLVLQHLLLVAATAGGAASLAGQLLTIWRESKAPA